MSTTDIKFTRDWTKYNGDLLVFVVPEKTKFNKKEKDVEQLVNELKGNGDFLGKVNEQAIFYTNTLKAFSGKAKRVMLLGFGTDESCDNCKRDQIRELGGLISQQAGKVKADNLLVVMPELKEITVADFLEPVIEGVMLGADA